MYKINERRKVTMKKNKIKVISKSSKENSLDKIHEESMKYNAHIIGTGAYKNVKYDKKIRRRNNKKECMDY